MTALAVVLGLCFTLLAACSRNTPSKEPTENDKGGSAKLVFSSQRDDVSSGRRSSDLYVLERGGFVYAVTTARGDGSGGYSAPAWSPDGLKIVATRHEGSTTSIVVMDADGSNERRVSSNETHASAAAWSPDGEHLAYDGHDLPGIKVVGSDGSNERVIPVPVGSGGALGHPSWAPDGQRIAFAYAPPTSESLSWRIAIVNVDGSGLHDVTHDGDGTAVEPAWSPDGTTLAFSAHAGPNFTGRVSTCTETVSLVAVDGKSPPRDLPKLGCAAHGPSWSSDGAHLAFTVSPAPGANDAIYVLDVGSLKAEQATDSGRDPSYFGRGLSPLERR